jgi:hypothetical protein
MKIAICVPHVGTLKAKTAERLAAMTFVLGSANISYNGKQTKPTVVLFFGGYGELIWKRTHLAHDALKAGSDYLLWIDSDQVFEPDALFRLMAHDKPIVGTNYATRHLGTPTAFDLSGKPIAHGSGLELVGAVGLGFCLMKTPILKRIPHPWFAVEVTPSGDLKCGEDVHFCNQARAAGIPIHVDHDLTIGHIAEREVSLKGSADDSTVLPAAGAQ